MGVGDQLPFTNILKSPSKTFDTSSSTLLLLLNEDNKAKQQQPHSNLRNEISFRVVELNCQETETNTENNCDSARAEHHRFLILLTADHCPATSGHVPPD